ncbi:MAG: hypothetical protein ACO3N9_06760 [Alphaproteobacteria bacterium]
MNSKVPNKQDQLADSIKLSLDAAEAAMDITTEFSEAQEKFRNAAKKTEKIYRLSFYGLIASVSISLISLLIVAGLFWRTTADLNVVTQSNLKLLKVFTEKVTEFQKASQFEKLTSQTNGIKDTVGGITETMSTMTATMEQSLSDVASLNTELKALKELLSDTQESLKTANGRMTEMTLAKIAELETSLGALSESNETTLKSTSEITEKVNKRVDQISKKLRAFNSEFRREMASIKKLQKTKIDDAANQIKFSR